MIIKIFKISTMEMWTVRNKKELIKLIVQEIGTNVSDTLSVNQLLKYFPIDDYCKIK